VNAEQHERMIRNENLDDALMLADRIRGYARPTPGEHAALRLAVEVRDLQTRVTELELENLRTLGPEQCCEHACNGGGCESCRCCAAGWCVTGTDGLPEGADLAQWIEVAAEHNPIVAAWTVDRARVAALEGAVSALKEEQRQLLVAAEAIGEGARSGYIPRAWEGDH